MKRLAIIISAPGGYDRRTERLAGIECDVKNWKNFFSSNIGGAWEEEEMQVISDPTRTDICCLHVFVESHDYDYVVLTFSGHGEYDETTGENVYYINNCLIPESDLLLNVDRQLSIFDACRVPVKDAFGLACFSEESALIKSFSNLREQDLRQWCKRAYNDAIMRLPCLDARMYSCSIGETANDMGTGGLFTLNLINGVKEIASRHSGIIFVNEAFSKAKIDTESMNTKQTPRCMLPRTPFPIGVSL
jgi:hypothetical protein